MCVCEEENEMKRKRKKRDRDRTKKDRYEKYSKMDAAYCQGWISSTKFKRGRLCACRERGLERERKKERQRQSKQKREKEKYSKMDAADCQGWISSTKFKRGRW